MQPKIVEGLTKAQITQIIKIAKGEANAARPSLQGLIYNVKGKRLTITDGYVLCSWELSNLREEVLPKKDSLIYWKQLNAWKANASAKDVLKWDDALSMVEPAKIPDIADLISKFSIKTERDALINPAYMEQIAPLFDGACIATSLESENAPCVPALVLRRQYGSNELPYNQTAIIMGMKHEH